MLSVFPCLSSSLSLCRNNSSVLLQPLVLRAAQSSAALYPFLCLLLSYQFFKPLPAPPRWLRVGSEAGLDAPGRQKHTWVWDIGEPGVVGPMAQMRGLCALWVPPRDSGDLMHTGVLNKHSDESWGEPAGLLAENWAAVVSNFSNTLLWASAPIAHCRLT